MFTILKSIITDALQTVSLNFARVAYVQMSDLVVGENNIPDMAANIMTYFQNGDIIENLDMSEIFTDSIKSHVHTYNAMLAGSLMGSSAKIATWGLNTVTDTLTEKTIESMRSYLSI